MPLSISELDKKWGAEADEYRTREVGSGVQKFVKDVLESEDLFSLVQGKLSTTLENRKNEFTEESRAKAGRKADVVVYVDRDIIIPVEVEKFGNISAGETQLKQYQTDFDKQYGILTDGFEWRFYNNNLFRTFNLPEILKDPGLFLSFWQSYIQPLSYYINFFEPLGRQKLFNKADSLSVEDNRILFFEDITKLIHSLENKLNVAGYLETVALDMRKRKAVELTYAYVIQFILYKTLVDNEFDDFKHEFNQRVEDIKESIKAEHFKQALSTIQGISDQISHNIYRPFAKEQEVISETLRQVLGAPKNSLPEVAPWLDIFVFIKKYNFSNVKNDIFGYIYENYLKDLYEEEQKGQYFTDPAVVDFMLNEIGYTPQNIIQKYNHDPQSISIIDPSCGSGTFLYSATHRLVEAFPGNGEDVAQLIEDIVNRNVFGLDIEEFPLYLAEMNILMRLMTYVINEKYNNPIDKKIKVFKTRDSISEFMDTGLKNTLVDQNVAFQRQADSPNQLTMFTEKLDLGYQSYVRNESDLEEMKKSLEERSQIPRQRFDYVVGNPPYIGYNQSSKDGLMIVKLIQDNKAQMSDIYGVNLNTVPGRIKAYAPKPNLYAFFIALGIALLKDNGKLCYIIPQTLLTSTDLDVVRYHLSKYLTINKIITFSGEMFIGRGIKQNRPVATSSLILVVTRKKPNLSHEVEITNATQSSEDIGKLLEKISNGHWVSRKKVMQTQLLHKIGNWNFIRYDRPTENFFRIYEKNSVDIDIYRLPELAKINGLPLCIFDKGLVFPKSKVTTPSSLAHGEDYYSLVEKRKNHISLGTSESVVAVKDIVFPKGSQGIKVYEKKYKILWSYMNHDNFYFSDKKVMVNFNWIIISSEDKDEILYLLSLLNSKVSKFVFERLLRLSGEKDLLLGIKAVKDYFRVPKITPANSSTKKKVIVLTHRLLDLEKVSLMDFVDLDDTLQQKYDSVSVDNDKLILTRGKQISTLPIKKSARTLKEAIENQKFDDEISLSELKNLTIFDIQEQTNIKNEVNELVYSLYNLTPEKKAIIEKVSN